MAKKNLNFENNPDCFKDYYKHTPTLNGFEGTLSFVKECLLKYFPESDPESIENAATGITCGFRYCITAEEKLGMTKALCSLISENKETGALSVFSKLIDESYRYSLLYNSICNIEHSTIKDFNTVARKFLVKLDIWKEKYIDENEQFWTVEWDIEYYRILWRGRYVESYEEFRELCHFVGVAYLGLDYQSIWGLRELHIKIIWENMDYIKKYKWQLKSPRYPKY